MENNLNSNKKSDAIFRSVIGCLILITISGLICLTILSLSGLFDANWFTVFISWISAASTMFLGLMVYKQNKIFNTETFNINNRLIELEENKEKALITFLQEGIICEEGFIDYSKGSSYTLVLEKNGELSKTRTNLITKIKNLTDVPIKQIIVKDVNIQSYNSLTKEQISIRSFNDVEDDIFSNTSYIDKKDIIKCIFIINGLANLVKDLPIKQWIILYINLITVSVFNRTVEQNYILVIDKEIPGDLPYSYQLTCYEGKTLPEFYFATENERN